MEKSVRRRIVTSFFLILVLLSGTTVSANVGLDAGTNAIRASANLTTLVTDVRIEQIAQTRAIEIASNYAHRDIGTDVQALFGCWEWWGENLAVFSPSELATDEWFIQSWYGSATHRANMLGDFDLIGSATYVDTTTNSVFAAQIFVRTCDNAGNTSNPVPSAQAGSSTPQEVVTILPNTSTLVGETHSQPAQRGTLCRSSK